MNSQGPKMTIKEMTLQELEAERKSLLRLIKHQQRAGHRTPELQVMKRRNVLLKTEICARYRVKNTSAPAVESVIEDFPDFGDIITFSVPTAPAIKPVLVEPLRMVVNG